MPYIVVTELETPSETSCKITGLQNTNTLETEISSKNLTFINRTEYFEVDVPAVKILNILYNEEYRVISQSMAIEYTTIGGRSVKIQKIIWTLCKDCSNGIKTTSSK